MSKFISTKGAPGAVGPYSQGAVAGDFIFTSGQVPINPEDGVLITGDIKKAALRSLTSCKNIIEEGGGKLTDVVKVEVFITDMANFGMVNEVYAEFFGDHKPARACVEVSKLPLGSEIEIQMIAYVK